MIAPSIFLNCCLKIDNQLQSKNKMYFAFRAILCVGINPIISFTVIGTLLQPNFEKTTSYRRVPWLKGI